MNAEFAARTAPHTAWLITWTTKKPEFELGTAQLRLHNGGKLISFETAFEFAEACLLGDEGFTALKSIEPTAPHPLLRNPPLTPPAITS